MTMILVVGNRDNVIQISDRRLTRAGSVYEEDWGKSGSIVFPNGRFAFGFSGIARVDGVDIRRWILNSLYDLGSPDYEIAKTFQRLKDHATNFFKTNLVLKSIKPFAKRLSMMFSGYLYFHDPPMIGSVIISNYQGLKMGAPSEKAWEEFESLYSNEQKPMTDHVSFIQRIGAWRAMTRKDDDEIRTMLKERKPYKAIISKAISIMHKMADRPEAREAIGKQLSWIRIPSATNETIETGYHSNIPTHATFIPSAVILLGDKNRSVFEEPVIEAVDPDSTPPMNYPKTNKNAPCPCGSGKRYKHCHGKINL